MTDSLLSKIEVEPIEQALARVVIRKGHYLHTYPGGTLLALGAFADGKLLGALTFGVGPINAHRLVDGAGQRDCLTLTRLWLDDVLPKNSESLVIARAVKTLKRLTTLTFLLSYADPAQGHVGTIYQAGNWLYTGLCQAQPVMDLGDGVPRHLRSVASALGTHSIKYLRAHGIDVHVEPRPAKHRYVLFLKRKEKCRLLVPTYPYPKAGDPLANRRVAPNGA